MNGKTVIFVAFILLPLTLGGGGWIYWLHRPSKTTLFFPQAPSFQNMTVGSPVPATRPVGALQAAIDRPAQFPAALGRWTDPLPDDVASWMTNWETNELSGVGPQPEQIEQLAQLISTDKLPAATEAQILCAIAFVDGNAIAAPLCDSAVESMAAELEKYDLKNPPPRSTLDAAWRLHDVVWDLERWDDDLAILTRAKLWEIPGSGHSQLVKQQMGEALYLRHRIDEALAVLTELESERKTATEASWGVNRPLDWEFGVTLYEAGRYKEAAERFCAATKLGASVPESTKAWPLLVAATANAGDVAGASQLLDSWIAQSHPPADQVASLTSLIDRLSGGAK